VFRGEERRRCAKHGRICIWHKIVLNSHDMALNVSDNTHWFLTFLFIIHLSNVSSISVIELTYVVNVIRI
jgi:hypothetical protein